jgi:hypothetical protein
MNEKLQENYAMLVGTQCIRDHFLDVFCDDELNFRLGGNTLSVGQLFHELGDIQYSYIQSFKTLTQSFDYPNRATAPYDTVGKLTAWFARLDTEMEAVLETLTGDEIIERGFPLPCPTQITVYQDAVLIVAAKLSIYLHALGKSMPEEVKGWID